MSLPHALLTALIEHPCSGAELAERFDRSIGHFWHATHQQIYRELNRLEAQGLVKSTPMLGSRGRKRSYEVLPQGRSELQRWTLEQEDPKPLRDALMVRLRADAAVGPCGLEEEMRRRLQWHEAKLALYQQIAVTDFGRQKRLGRAGQLRSLVLEAGIQQEQVWIDVVRKALDLLSSPADSSPVRRGVHPTRSADEK
ncbi:MAG: PadR family transcriptional regulator [Comamonadaceae bacterium SCN 68-20]|jgi:DNA-binding PadR family transcriptional regulator|nr:MAG: PadR family transcriptional regulator [Comamonadaceae bacterium SCN 68-20]OJX25038.1 MAG: PadR family transcriptional regulator [Burkholderiales bacterium 68-20]UJB64876.1 PadR family transcriptional regulator [Acidovorax sp. YS12]